MYQCKERTIIDVLDVGIFNSNFEAVLGIC